MSDDLIAAVLLDLVARRGAVQASACPSDVARALAADWRPLMPRVRAVAAALQRAGLVRVTRRGLPVAAESAGGPIRLHARARG